MRRFVITLASVLALALLLVPAVSAANPHFVAGPDVTADDGALLVTGSIAGLGNDDVTINVVGTATLTCENRGGNTPPGQTETVSGSQVIEDPANGRVNFAVITGEVSDPCPGPMEPTVEWESVTLTVVQGGDVVLEEAL